MTSRLPPRPSKRSPHAFHEDTTIPPDHAGRRWCVCGLPGEQGDARHPDDAPPLTGALPPTPEDARDLDNRRLGERTENAA